MRTGKKLTHLKQLDHEAAQQALYEQMAEQEATEAAARGKPTMVVPILTFTSKGRLLRCVQPFALYAEPMNGGVLVTAGFTQAAGLGGDINEAIHRFLAGIEHRFLYLTLHSGSMVPSMEDELRALNRFVALV